MIERHPDHERAFLSAIVESSNDGIIGVSRDGIIKSWNRGAEQIYGYSAAEVIGTPLREMARRTVLPDLLERETTLLLNVLRGHPVKPFETIGLRKDGSQVDLQVSVSLVRNPNGEVLGIASTMRDITNHKRAEAEARANRDRLVAALGSMSDAVFICDSDGNFVHFNTAFALIHRFGSLETCLTSLKDYPALFELRTRQGRLVPFEDWPVYRALQGKTAVGQEVEIRRKDTGESWIASLNYAPIRDQAGRITGAVLTERDVTERRRAEEALRRSEERYRMLHEGMRDGFVQTAMDGRILDLNDVYCQMLGYSADELRGMLYQDLTPERWHPIDEAAVNEQILIRGYSDVYEKEYRRKDGTVFPVELRATLSRDRQGRPESVWAIVRDISERRRNEARVLSARDELVHVGRLSELSQVSAGIAHELNQPLAAMLNYSSAARRVIAAGAPSFIGEASLYIARATEQAQRAGMIIRRMRGFIERQEMNRTIEDVNAIVKESVALIGAVPEGIAIRLDLAPGLPPVFADRLQLQHVLVNLARNAAEAMSQTPVRELTVATARSGTRHVAVRVADTGPGISKEVADRLFVPFFTTKRDGMGIGLVISRSIVESHGGHISVESRPGAGATFRFDLPIAETLSLEKACPLEPEKKGGRAVHRLHSVAENRAGRRASNK